MILRIKAIYIQETLYHTWWKVLPQGTTEQWCLLSSGQGTPQGKHL